ncbi:MAG: alpha/beta hydrolase [Winogradskyella sp.]|uniref:alpha/beta hydrolase n=1 Tax=Winogradskyella sp. TaxID=1883156 RepID=UPI000F3B565C|nr:alpha/beta hydrolase [Winogradskyella sp.]RNC86335.1 MAG: alpha/beta hydrolase [Winogradskyella sp.]
MRYIIIVVVVFGFQLTSGQTEYLDSLYTVEKTTHTFQKFNRKDSLQLDFYKPKNVTKKLPLLLYVHGGGFSGGVRDDSNTIQFANMMAEKGYAVASVSYRLIMKKKGFGCDTKTKDKIEAFDTAAEDISYAIKHIIKNKSDFNIDEDKIVISGTSAGAEAVLHLAYVYESKILPKKFKLAGVIGMAGAITTLDQIDSDKAIPTQLFHGTNDNLVPYHIAAHHYCSPEAKGYMILHGSRAIADRLKGLGKSYYLFSINGGTHSWSGIPLNRCVMEVTDFLYNDVLNDAKRQTERTIGF